MPVVKKVWPSKCNDQKVVKSKMTVQNGCNDVIAIFLTTSTLSLDDLLGCPLIPNPDFFEGHSFTQLYTA